MSFKLLNITETLQLTDLTFRHSSAFNEINIKQSLSDMPYFPESGFGSRCAIFPINRSVPSESFIVFPRQCFTRTREEGFYLDFCLSFFILTFAENRATKTSPKLNNILRNVFRLSLAQKSLLAASLHATSLNMTKV